MLDHVTRQDRIDLASEPPFDLGGVHVIPALLQVEWDGSSLTLEPRVMQVLVALAQSAGRVVSRSELVDRCWDGRIVGENAIQRVISRIRHLAAEVGGFELETITKVGYRLRPLSATPDAFPETDAAPTPRERMGLSRRGMAIGGLAAAGVAAGLFAWRAIGADKPDAEAARTLVARGRDAMGWGLRVQNEQAIAYLRQATRLDPGSAEAWGALALAYQHALEGEEGAAQQALADWTGSASRRALALDPGNMDASVALATIPSNFRQWAANEARLRALMAARGGHSAAESALGWLLCDTGRWQEAIGCFRRALAPEPFVPANQLILAWGLWGGGQMEEADRILEQAFQLWPQHRGIWQTRFEFLALTGRAGQAIALIDDERRWPVTAPDSEPPPYPIHRRFAVAMKDGATPDVRDALIEEIAAARSALGTISVVNYLGALGAVDRCFEVLEAFYFGGNGAPAPGPLSRRKTSILFSAKGEPLRTSPRYRGLLTRLGLDAYWRETGSRPDRALPA
ncbi:winged helix-turn-helix domain-containing protein [Sandaracinobacter sp.]|uniref:winged helix-turn-helix domain-containing protein n=1 Tax=Sandaracinobacter sp. TaxID=2487581 RepID=UPI0035B247E8